MARLHLFEFEDQPWCPAVLRDAITGYLRFVIMLTRQHVPVAAALARLLQRTGESSILDLCSGSGAIAGRLADALAAAGVPARIVLSDLYPNAASFRELAAAGGGRVTFLERPLDATAVPPALEGVRTMFNAFHHFPPQSAREVLAGAARAGRPIVIVEFIERRALSLLGVLFSPLLVFVAAPLLGPFRWQTLLLTWIIPVVPLVVLWDGLVSWLRVYSLDELRGMTESVAAPHYVWEIGHWGRGPLRVTYVVGQRQ